MEETTEVGPLIARLSAVEAGWLARCILDKCRKDREAFGETIEDSLKVIPLLFAITQRHLMRL
jgi:hypothetical protein